MNSKVMRILAVLFALGAVLTGYWGYRLSQQPLNAGKTANVPSDVQKSGSIPAVFAVHQIDAGHAIADGDVKLVMMPVRVEGAFASLADAVGKVPTIPVAAGEQLSARHFAAASQLARAVAAGERAIAIKVDEVIGGGGFVQSGDYVDVLVYLRAGTQEVRASSAQVVLHHVRVLAFGDTLGAKESVLPGATGKQGTSAVKSRAAVLAVPAAQASRLMLAASAGELRLAVYGAEEGQHSAVATGARDLVTLTEMARGAAAAPEPQRSQTGRPRAVTIYHGNTRDVVN